MTKDVFKEKAEKTLGKLKEGLSNIRTGRANPSLVENIGVEYYGTITPLVQLATITAPEPRLLVIQPWDKTQMKAVETALQQSDLQLPATNDGQVIRVALPTLTEERRLEYVKIVHKRHEEAKIALKSIREEYMRELKDAETSEDARHIAEKEVQELVQEYQNKFTEHSEEKEEEITSIT